MNRNLPLCLVMAVLFLSACTTAECPPDRISYLESAAMFPQENMEKNTESGPNPLMMEIRGQQIPIDLVIDRPGL